MPVRCTVLNLPLLVFICQAAVPLGQCDDRETNQESHESASVEYRIVVDDDDLSAAFPDFRSISIRTGSTGPEINELGWITFDVSIIRERSAAPQFAVIVRRCDQELHLLPPWSDDLVLEDGLQPRSVSLHELEEESVIVRAMYVRTLPEYSVFSHIYRWRIGEPLEFLREERPHRSLAEQPQQAERFSALVDDAALWLIDHDTSDRVQVVAIDDPMPGAPDSVRLIYLGVLAVNDRGTVLFRAHAFDYECGFLRRNKPGIGYSGGLWLFAEGELTPLGHPIGGTVSMNNKGYIVFSSSQWYHGFLTLIRPDGTVVPIARAGHSLTLACDSGREVTLRRVLSCRHPQRPGRGALTADGEVLFFASFMDDSGAILLASEVTSK